ncbi:MAG: dTDP-4-keto-6-deoxy-D-glucose epimerase [Alphaproteobacteria bacterium]|nr:dTDP-4-keto-6-deoxy-D-glucose epimerase [Alphaproteobacteria bacterium]
MSTVRVEKTKLDGVLLIHPPTQFSDFRGQYVETYNRELYHAAGITDDFIQDDASLTKKHVLRGIHGDAITTKMISCLYGELYAVVVNNNPASAQYRQWQGFTLNDTNNLQVYIPPTFGNSFVVLSDMALFHYKQTTTYDRAGQFTLLWNDPALAIQWPIAEPILSQRDSGKIL